MIENGNKSDITEKRYHHEIYLSDPRKRVMTNAKPIRISVRKDQRATKTSRLPTLPPQASCAHPNEKSECVFFFSVEYFGIKVDLDGKKKKQPGVQAKVYSKSY